MTLPTMDQPNRWNYAPDDYGLSIYSRDLAAWHTHEIARLSAEIIRMQQVLLSIERKLQVRP